MFRDYEPPSNTNRLEQLIQRSESMELGEFGARANEMLESMRSSNPHNVSERCVQFLFHQVTFPDYHKPKPHELIERATLYISRPGEAPEFIRRANGMISKALPFFGVETMYGKDARFIGYRFTPDTDVPNVLFVPESKKPRVIIW